MDKNALPAAVRPADILLPKKDIDLEKWATVACDQFTSQPEYWEKVENFVGNAPSTLKITYPEVYLEQPDKEERIRKINQEMRRYLDGDIFETYPDSFILVERTCSGSVRYGLMAALDLECYDYSKGSRTQIRATEGTILERIPPRKEIRKNAGLELPHIMVLISDEKESVIEPLVGKKDGLKVVYDTELMMDGGHLKGYLVDGEEDKQGILKAFKDLEDRLDPANPLLFAMGDGNHSLATAKSCWEDLKQGLDDKARENHPSRFALVEIENIFCAGLGFEPIHRVFFNLSEKDFSAELIRHAKSVFTKKVESSGKLLELINAEGTQKFGISTCDGLYLCEIIGAECFTAAATMQLVIDALLKNNLCTVDYIHGVDVTIGLSQKEGNIGIILPDVSKKTFFETILKDGSFPRKTFSIGHANEKRYYMEARRIR